jgi:hypothetical protein
MVKETMKRKKPSFNETYYGFRTFSQLLEDAQRRGIVQLRRDQKSGSYVVEDLGSSVGMRSDMIQPRTEATPPPRTEPAPQPRPEPAAAAEAEGNGPRTRRRRSRGRGRGKAAAGVPGSGESAPQGVEDGAELDDHDHDHEEGEEEATAAESEHEAPAADREPAPEPAEHPAQPQAFAPEEPPARSERPFLSLFSWVRRDPREEEGKG